VECNQVDPCWPIPVSAFVDSHKAVGAGTSTYQQHRAMKHTRFCMMFWQLPYMQPWHVLQLSTFLPCACTLH
jgi:hypothetical protein